MLSRRFLKSKYVQSMFCFQQCTALHTLQALKCPEQPKPFSDIPEPKGLPILGTLLDRTPIRNFDPQRLYQYFEKRHKALGSIYKEKLLSDMDVFICAPEDVKAIFRINEKYPNRPKLEPVVKGRQILNINEGIVNAQGEDWFRVRKLYNDHLLTNKSIWMYTKQHFEVCHDLMNYMEQHFDQKQEIPDFEYALNRWSLECATVFATDTKLGAFKTDLPADTKLFIESTLDLFSIWGKMMYSVPLWKYFNTKLIKQLKRRQNDQIISLNQYLKRTSTHGASRLHTLVANSDLKQSEKEVVFVDILGAGVDTTSNAASFLLYCLATNPEKQEKLREEIRHFTKSEEEITGKVLQQMKYLHAVNMETQRLFPLVIGTSRKLKSDMVLSGYHVPADTLVLFTANIINNRDPKYFDDPDSFIPERWLDRNKENRFVITGSFGIGARMCPGRRFALQEVSCLVITLLSRYRIEYHYEPFELIFSLVSKATQKPKFAFIPI